ncbi:MAG: Holliday junction DNA helicase RuvA [Bacteriovoracaceae bacterium]|jgi:Holliday junction DNA helicase RuvA
MIGHIQGKVLFSDGVETIVLTSSGIGYQVYYNRVLSEGSFQSLFISHQIKEASEQLFGFPNLRDKKMFELLTSVKGVGPKGAFNLLGFLGTENIIESILLENKKTLTKAPGVGPKAAAQIILDLSKKISKIRMYSPSYKLDADNLEELPAFKIGEVEKDFSTSTTHLLMDEALVACKELGFREEQVLPLAQKILNDNEVTKAEQLVHLVLKEI